MIERQTPEVWDILEEVTKGHPVLLNRAPTLHRLSIQAFEPLLVEGEAIRIHPLVCTAYNADFDGDQMAVHVPLSVEAQMQARLLMLPPNNIYSPSIGKPLTTPSQDIVLGCYYLTQNPRKNAQQNERLRLFSEPAEIEYALSEGAVKIHEKIRFKNPDFGQKTIFGNSDFKVIETTAGRVVFNGIWPRELGFFNRVAAKKQLSDIIWRTYQVSAQQKTVETLDRLKELGFYWATKAGVSIGITDMIIPDEKKTELDKAYKQISLVEKQYRSGIITDGERYNVIIVEPDCGTANGIVVRPIYEGDDEVVDLATRIVGRVSCETINNPVTKDTIIKSNQLIEEPQAQALMSIGVEYLKIRSVLTCESKRGVCAHCYGRNLATGRMVKLGEAVGIIAAQSIGEPGTQLTMRTFHIGGTATQLFKQPIIKAKNDGEARFNDLRVVQSVDGNYIALNKNGSASVHAKDGRELERYNVVVGSVISVGDGGQVKKAETFVQWDPYNDQILTEKTGRVEFRDMIPGVTVKREIDEATGVMGTVVIEHKEDLHPQIVILDENKKEIASYAIPAGAHIVVQDGSKIPAGTLLAKTPRKIAKTKDITGGLPRVV